MGYSPDSWVPACESRNRSRTDLVPPLNPFLALPGVTVHANVASLSAASASTNSTPSCNSRARTLSDPPRHPGSYIQSFDGSSDTRDLQASGAILRARDVRGESRLPESPMSSLL